MVGGIDTYHHNEFVNVPLISETVGDGAEVAQAIGLKVLPASYDEYHLGQRISQYNIPNRLGDELEPHQRAFLRLSLAWRRVAGTRVGVRRHRHDERVTLEAFPDRICAALFGCHG